MRIKKVQGYSDAHEKEISWLQRRGLDGAVQKQLDSVGLGKGSKVDKITKDLGAGWVRAQADNVVFDIPEDCLE